MITMLILAMGLIASAGISIAKSRGRNETLESAKEFLANAQDSEVLEMLHGKHSFLFGRHQLIFWMGAVASVIFGVSAFYGGFCPASSTAGLGSVVPRDVWGAALIGSATAITFIYFIILWSMFSHRAKFQGTALQRTVLATIATKTQLVADEVQRVADSTTASTLRRRQTQTRLNLDERPGSRDLIF